MTYKQYLIERVGESDIFTIQMDIDSLNNKFIPYIFDEYLFEKYPVFGAI